MDPKQTLIDAEQAVSDCAWAAALEHLANYWSWRQRGGFEPRNMPQNGYQNGDAWALWCMRRMADALRNLEG